MNSVTAVQTEFTSGGDPDAHRMLLPTHQDDRPVRSSANSVSAQRCVLQQTTRGEDTESPPVAGCVGGLPSSNDGLIHALFSFPIRTAWLSGDRRPSTLPGGSAIECCVPPTGTLAPASRPTAAPAVTPPLRACRARPWQYRSSARPPPLPRCRPHDSQCQRQTLLICSPHRSAEPLLSA
jgi:hypothetical protein